MSARFATWLRVTPPPTTLAESSAVYQALNKQGRLDIFTKQTAKDGYRVASSALYRAVFAREPPSLRTTFEISVYDGIPSAHDEDPFNIRGLQSRKPMPPPKTFKCNIERAEHKQEIGTKTPYNGHFNVRKGCWMEDVLFDTGAPPGIARGCGIRVDNEVVDPETVRQQVAPSGPTPAVKSRKINMGSILDMWREAHGIKPKVVSKSKAEHVPFCAVGDGREYSKAVRAPRRLVLRVDQPLGSQRTS